jgi:hypothetical protein
MDASPPIAEEALDLAGTEQKMWVRMLAPVLSSDGRTWACAYTIDAPISVEGQGTGETSLLAVVEALRSVSRALYGSGEYKSKQIGVEGVFGRQLTPPATSDMLDIAPHPF